jgi:hypothetical protein
VSGQKRRRYPGKCPKPAEAEHRAETAESEARFSIWANKRRGLKPWSRALDDDAALELTVETVTRTAHQVPMSKPRLWLGSTGKDPREAAMKAELR